MEKQQNIQFYRLCVHAEEGHYEDWFMTFGTPQKTLPALQEEAENEFYYAASEGKSCDLRELLYQKLSAYGYQKVEATETICYPDPYYMESDYIQKKIIAIEGDAYFDEAFKERLNRIRIENGKESYPIIRKKRGEKELPVQGVKKEFDKMNILEAFDDFLESVRKETEEKEK